MVLFNYSTKELTAKVVYYGPGLCGKTTNLQWIHEKLPIKNKGKMLSLATETDRTLFFDFLPIEIGTIRGMKTRIQLYTVPGQVFYNATRRMVLKGADAVVFVCDSQEASFEANRESFENLRQNLIANEIDPDEIPMVLQYNKRDLPNALPIEILNERLNVRGYPFYEAVAVRGIGVEETLKAVTKVVFKALSAKYGDAAVPNRGITPSRPPTAGASVPPEVPPAPPRVPSGESLPGRASLPPEAKAPRPTPAPENDEPVRFSPPPPPGQPEELPHIDLDDDLEDDLEEEIEVPIGTRSFEGLPPLDLELGAEGFGAQPTTEPLEKPAAAHRRPDVPTQPPVPPTPPPRPLERPEMTIVTRRDEADELRRRIATPGLVEPAGDAAGADEDLELEELEPEPDHSLPLSLNSSPPLPPVPVEIPPPPREPESFEPPPPRNPTLRTTPAPAPPPVQEMQIEETFDTDEGDEVEVPIDVEVPPGTTRLTLRLKLTLNLRR